MIGPLSVLAIWTIVRSVEATVGWLLNSAGEANLLALLSGLLLVPLVASLILAAELADATAVAWVMVANAALGLLIVGFVADRRVGIPMREHWRALWPFAVAGATAWVTASAVVEITGASPPLVSLLAGLATGAATYVGVLAVVQRSALEQALGQVRRMAGRKAVVPEAP